MRRSFATSIVVGCLVLTACGGAGDDDVTRDDEGNVADSGDLGVFRMRVGDCFDFPDETSDDGIESLPAVPCDQSHDAEVYAVYDHDAATYPGDTAMSEAADEGCLSRFSDFTGGPYESSALFYSQLYPSEDSWEGRDDREVICYVFIPEEKLTGTARGYDAGSGGQASGGQSDEPVSDGSADPATGQGTAVSVFELFVGDCFDDDSVDNSGDVETVEVIDCATPHDNEVFHLFDLPDGAYPGDEAVDDAGADGCLGAFDGYVGIAYADSVLDVLWLVPDQELWDQVGDREVVCILYHIDLEKLEGSMRGAAI